MGDPADVVVAAFLLGRVRGAGLDTAAASCGPASGPAGSSRSSTSDPDAAGGPPPGVAWTWHEPALLEAALVRAGFAEVGMAETGRFFLIASAVAR